MKYTIRIRSLQLKNTQMTYKEIQLISASLNSGSYLVKKFNSFLRRLREVFGQAEICEALRAIELAYQNDWYNLWLETDSSLVALLFKKKVIFLGP